MQFDFEPLRRMLHERLAENPHLAGLNLQQAALPSLRLEAERVPANRIGIGASRLGGTPDVPAGFEWPRWVPPNRPEGWFSRAGTQAPVPLSFIAQIDLGALPRIDDAAPSAGWLYFFYDCANEPWGFDPADRGCSRVIYADCARSALQRATPPPDIDPQYVAELCAVTARPELTLPADPPGIDEESEASDSYFEFCWELNDSGGPAHRLLGHAEIIQSPMELECQLVSNGWAGLELGRCRPDLLLDQAAGSPFAAIRRCVADPAVLLRQAGQRLPALGSRRDPASS